MTDYENTIDRNVIVQLMNMTRKCHTNFANLLLDYSKLEENGFDKEEILAALKEKYNA